MTPKGHVLLLDPWITNPANTDAKKDLAALDDVDYILITHGHSDHVGNAVAIAKRTGAILVANSDLGNALVVDDGYPASQATLKTLGNSGGTIHILHGEVSVTFVPAVHGSTLTVGHGKSRRIGAGGNPNGFVIRIQNGPTIYDTGDTDVFLGMKLISQFNHIDIMLACIGNHFTMGPKQAALAVQFVQPDIVIPMHYGTFPLLTGTPEVFGKAIKARKLDAKLNVMKIGETLSF